MVQVDVGRCSSSTYVSELVLDEIVLMRSEDFEESVLEIS